MSHIILYSNYLLLCSPSSLSDFPTDICKDETSEDLRRGDGEDDLRLFPVTSSKMEETRVLVRRSTLAVDAGDEQLPPFSSCKLGKLDNRNEKKFFKCVVCFQKNEALGKCIRIVLAFRNFVTFYPSFGHCFATENSIYYLELASNFTWMIGDLE